MIGAKSTYLPAYSEGFINLHGGIQQKQGGLFTYRGGLKYFFEREKAAKPQKSVNLPTYLRCIVLPTDFTPCRNYLANVEITWIESTLYM